MSTKVYKYGLLRPTENSDLVMEQLQSAHRYRNQLVELEWKRRDQIRALIDQDTVGENAEVQQAEQECQQARADLANDNAQHRSRAKADPQLREVYQTVKQRRKQSYTVLKKARSRVFKNRKEAITEINTEHREAVKAARKVTDTYWGTYQLVEDALKASAGDKYLWDLTKPLNPDFRRWRQEGRLSVQLQKDPQDRQNGLAAENVFTPNTLMWIDPVDERAWHDPVRGVRRRLSRTRLRIRIGSDGRQPIWATFPMIMHRPLPEGSRVKRVTVNRRSIGTRTEWTVDFTIDVSAVRPEQHPVSGTVAIDVGWRQMDDGSIRVATWDASDDQKGYLELPADLISALTYHRTLNSIRRQNHNEALARLVEYFREHPMPEWMRQEMSRGENELSPAQACAALAQWRSMRRLARLTRRWAQEGVTAEHQAAYDELEAWRYHEFHLYEWEANQQKKSQRRRKDLYRNFAAQLSRCYRVLVLEDFKLDRIARNPDVDEDTENETARSNRQLVAVYELRDTLGNAFKRCGEVAIVPPQHSTQICHACGVVNQGWDQAAELEHRCCACGELWDQDDNASRVLRRRYERLVGDGNAGAARGAKKGNGSKDKKKNKRPSRSFRELHRRRQKEAARDTGPS